MTVYLTDYVQRLYFVYQCKNLYTLKEGYNMSCQYWIGKAQPPPDSLTLIVRILACDCLTATERY